MQPVSPKVDNATCMDFPPQWVDSGGRGCGVYEEQDWCTEDGGYGQGWGTFTSSTFNSFEHNGHSAVGACCACSGGLRGELLQVLRPHLHETVTPAADATAEKEAHIETTTAEPTSTMPSTTTPTTTQQLTRSELHCLTEGRDVSYGSWGRPTAPDGTACHFPFIWNGVSYGECTNVEYDRMWCYVGPEPSDGWGNCKCEDHRYRREHQCRTVEEALGTTAAEGMDCHFPFEFEGQNFTDCTSAGRGEGGRLWCAIGTTIDGGWGNCACEDVWVDVSSSSANQCIDMIRSYPDRDAWEDDCSYYIGREEQCGQADTLHFQAGMLCCACGGGHRSDYTHSVGDVVLAKNEAEDPWTEMIVTRMIPTMVVPTGAPEGTQEQTMSLIQPCANSELWSDVVWGEGHATCADLDSDNDFGSPTEWCTAYGEASDLVRQNCPILCGTCLEIRGGIRPEAATEGGEPTAEELEDGSEQAICSDMDNGQVDTDGDNCAYYQRFPHACGCCDRLGSLFGSSQDQSFVAVELCCACGGGFRGRPGA